MSTQEEAAGTESLPLSDQSITIGLAVTSSKSSKYAVKWALKNFGARERTRFMLIHVRQKVTLVPTPMGNYVPVDQVRDDIAAAYKKEVECEAQNMLLTYKNMCNGKVETEVLVVKGDDVAETISGVVSACQIHKLVVGASSQGKFMRKSKGTRTCSRICKSVPSFCMVDAISKGGLSMVYSPGSDGDSSSEIFQVNDSSSSELYSDDKPSVSDITPSRISRSNLLRGNLDSSSSADNNRPRSLQEHLTGSTLTSIVDKDRSSSHCGTDQITESNLPISDKSPTLSRALHELMRSEDKASTPCASGHISAPTNLPVSDKAPTVKSALHELMLSEDKANTPCASDKIPGSSNLPITDKATAVSNSLQELMLSENKEKDIKPRDQRKKYLTRRCTKNFVFLLVLSLLPMVGAAGCDEAAYAIVLALRCADRLPSPTCCNAMRATVDSGGINCLCRTTYMRPMVSAAINETDVLNIYSRCGGSSWPNLEYFCGAAAPATSSPVPPPPPPPPHLEAKKQTSKKKYTPMWVWGLLLVAAGFVGGAAIRHMIRRRCRVHIERVPSEDITLNIDDLRRLVAEDQIAMIKLLTTNTGHQSPPPFDSINRSIDNNEESSVLNPIQSLHTQEAAEQSANPASEVKIRRGH